MSAIGQTRTLALAAQVPGLIVEAIGGPASTSKLVELIRGDPKVVGPREDRRRLFHTDKAAPQCFEGISLEVQRCRGLSTLVFDVVGLKVDERIHDVIVVSRLVGGVPALNPWPETNAAVCLAVGAAVGIAAHLNLAMPFFEVFEKVGSAGNPELNDLSLDVPQVGADVSGEDRFVLDITNRGTST